MITHNVRDYNQQRLAVIGGIAGAAILVLAMLFALLNPGHALGAKKNNGRPGPNDPDITVNAWSVRPVAYLHPGNSDTIVVRIENYGAPSQNASGVANNVNISSTVPACFTVIKGSTTKNVGSLNDGGISGMKFGVRANRACQTAFVVTVSWTGDAGIKVHRTMRVDLPVIPN